MMWVNDNDLYTSKPGFVLDKGAELIKRPAVQRGSLGATNRYPSAEAPEVFESNSASGVFRGRHDALADRVIDAGRKPMLFAGQLLEASSRRLRPFALQPGRDDTRC